MNFEYVYILTNPAMPEWVKVGKSKNIKSRLSNLNKKTAVPLPFVCFAALKVPSENIFNIEHGLHKFLGLSFQKEKEFFRTSKERVLEYFEITHGMIPNSELLFEGDLNKETSAEKKKAAATTFELLEIPVCSELIFIKDSKIVCKVEDKINQVSYNGEQYSLSGLAVKLCGYNVNGYTRFMFEDETLWKRRQRLHPEL